MFREAANNDMFDEFRKVQKVGDKSAACLSCAGTTPLSIDRLHRQQMVGNGWLGQTFV